MKKIITLFLILTMILSLSACGTVNKINVVASLVEKAASSMEESLKSDGTKESMAEERMAEESGTEETSAPQEESSQVSDAKELEPTFTETVVVDNEECAVMISGIEEDPLWGYTLKTQLVNKSADKTYMFAIISASINGVECDPLFAKEVTAGNKANEGISFLTDDLEKNGITVYTDLALTFRVYDSEDWLSDEVALATVHIYPYGEENAQPFVRESQPSDNVIIDTDDVTVIVTGCEIDELWGYTVNLFVLNKTDKNIMFSVDDAAVNGIMLDPFYAATISAGNCAFDSLSWSDIVFEENDIDDVETIEITFRAYDNDDWSADDIVKETVTLKP